MSEAFNLTITDVEHLLYAKFTEKNIPFISVNTLGLVGQAALTGIINAI